MLNRRRGTEREHGQMLVLFSLVLVVILAFAAIAVDLGVLRNNKQILRNTMDAAALAGGTLLPVDGSVAGKAAAVNKLIDSTIQKNYPGLPTSAYTISYRCLIGVNGNVADVSQITAGVCNPSHALGHTPVLATDFTGAGPTRSSVCNPSGGDKCNVVVVTGSATTDYGFGGAVGITSGSTGAVQSAACNGPCGAQPLKLNDVELVIDTSGSMNANPSNGHVRIYWAQLAAKQLVTDLSNNGGIGATGNRVGITTFSGTTASSAPTAWTSTAAQLAATINAISASGTTPTKVGLQTGASDLSAIGHARNAVGGAVQRVLILLSDGRPNPDQGPNGLPATSAANNMRPTQNDIDAYLGSADVKYSILIGKPPPSYPIGAGPYLDPNVVDPDMMKLLATPDKPSAIPPETYFFNVVDASGLPSVFHQIAGQILGSGAHLIQVYPTPVVTGVGPSSGTHLGGNSVLITGQYFSGVMSVTFGGVNAPGFTVTSDTSITATVPAGSNGSTVDIRVTTGGGASPIVTADRYTYN